ncbi:hypothetical protein AMATHDRAFT_50993 [Amanita thiersii Skay4041]|uniref:F-box domain-containing protein n=1 Tax=Amanita thiersii Skay4041 TaxID=703135 RepID=A0A2A9NB23_9AGAR|nr:hypothetical protein AMATHDRAFT_50993 [Amanita thiersii Skay4041]
MKCHAQVRSEGILSPTEKLPTELWVEIFLYCILDVSYLTRNHRPHIPIIFRLSHVCQSWRRICLSTPELWAVIRIPLDFPDILANATTNYISLMLRYSDPTPLTLSIVFTRESTEHLAPFKLLLKHVHRWQFVQMFGLSLGTTPLVGLHAPLLKHLRITSSFADGQQLQFPFASCPALERLSWPQPYLETGPNAPIPWDRLASLNLWDLTPFQAVHFLRCCSRLSKATFVLRPSPDGGEQQDPDSPPHVLSVIQHQLTELLLCGHLWGGDLFFNTLCLPRLSYLSVRLCEISSLAGFLRRSNCTLLALSVIDFLEDPATLFDILATPACPSLTQLEVRPFDRRRGFLPDRLMEALTFDASKNSSPAGMSTVFCPNLTQLTLTSVLPTTPGLLGRMIESRFKQVNGCLKHFEYTHRGADKSDLDILTKLQEMGYRVELHSNG